jgi:hypothetical protein
MTVSKMENLAKMAKAEPWWMPSILATDCVADTGV